MSSRLDHHLGHQQQQQGDEFTKHQLYIISVDRLKLKMQVIFMQEALVVLISPNLQ